MRHFFLRDRLAPYEVPQYIEFRDMLPKSKVGKMTERTCSRRLLQSCQALLHVVFLIRRFGAFRFACFAVCLFHDHR